MGYTLLGRVIEAVTGERYEIYLDQQLLAPLGMHDSTFAFTTQARAQADPRLAMGHFDNGATQAAVPIYLRPASQFTTTAADMGRFARFLVGDGRIGNQPFIAPHLLRAMGQPHGTEAARAGLEGGYALGLATRDRYGAVGKCHSGNTVGYRAMICVFPQHRKAYFIAMNTDSETADYGRFDELMIKALQVQAPAPAPGTQALASTAPAARTSIEPAAWEGFYVPAPNRFASLVWIDTVFNVVRVKQEGGGLRVMRFQADDVTLTPAGGALYRARGRVAASHVLLAAEDGRKVFSNGLQSYQTISLLELVSLWGSLLMGVLGMLYLLAAGLVGVVRRRLSRSSTLLYPFGAIVALLLVIPLFYRQSILQMGDLTVASTALAIAAAMLPVAMFAGLVQGARAWRQDRVSCVAMLGVLQLTGVSAWWGLLPLRLWA